MARIKKTENNLINSYNQHKNYAILLFVISGLSFMLFIPTFGLTGIPFVISLILGAINLNKASAYKSGIVGEAKSESILATLPDDYYIFPSIDIEYEGKKSQIDHLVVGPTGVFIVEAKNVNGYIVGSDKDKDITIHKVGQKGGQYESKMYNPTKQVATHVYRTAGYLKEQGIDTWVQGMVYFTNPTTTVRLQSNKMPVFAESEDGRKEIYNYILKFENKNPLDEVEIMKIVNAIERNINQQRGSYYSNGTGTRGFNTIENSYMYQQTMQQQAPWQHGFMHQQTAQQQMIEQQLVQQQAIQHAMDEGIKSVTPFDHGGYVQGPGFNPSDTMAQHNTMSHMF